MSTSPHKSRSSILIVLIAGIGDMALASKAIRTVRNGHPDAEIHLLTSTEGAHLAVNYPFIDYVHAFPIRELRKDKKYLFDIVRLIRDLRRTKFDLVLNLYRVSSLSGAVKMGLLVSMFEAKAKIGHDKHGFGLFLTKKVPAETFERQHVVGAMMEIASRAGGIPDVEGIEVFWNERITSKWENFFARLAGNIIVGINPGGDRENRRWAPDRFATVIEKIMERCNARIILLGGPADRDIVSYIQNRVHSDVSNLSGEIPLDELGCVISQLDLLITNDSGPMHIAAATKTPLVAIFGPEDPKLFGPYTRPELYRVLHKDVPCRPCKEKKCTRPLCLDRITPDEVVAACIELLQGKS
ncbi:MAG: glycosyltransferase family 9 protein [Syntrophales bacterium]